MKYFFNRIYILLTNLQSKIAFYPSVLAFFGFLIAFTLIYFENQGASKYLLEHIPMLVVNNGDTALSILTVCITGLISMMVFSFSMVMVLLNQAASNYSPRLLPGLISDKNHQFILGTYLATIIYCIFVAVSIQPEGGSYQTPGFSVLVGIILTVFCIGAFIYFIHNISQSIQINNILDNTFSTAKTRLKFLLKNEKTKQESFPETDNWYEYHSEKSGYFQNLSEDNLLDICKKEETKIEILPVKGIFILNGIPLFKSKKELDEATVKKVLSNFSLARGELVNTNYVLAFKQITEVILKAMSPGINDPGTALNAIDYLTELFALRMQKQDTQYIKTKGEVFIKMASVDFEELLYQVLAPIRAYCKHDIIIVQQMGMLFYYLKTQESISETYYKAIDKEARNFLADAKSTIKNEADIDRINAIERQLNLKS
ncbi:Uncharacterized membrane protein [Salegentibacter holothuriorum]|uniref:Uncharacterized membrane protein n=1 Tax=Salegentibacter holothuriorum TaxID=241145 RepID=A0A1T5CRG5_9FLAO|nr:DUF2254 domain-containing protein [Salegentibacter holothuriorum]SKB61946.1 Uncharacterized membrane protein [Salegentibacter holothuriorum]